MRSIVRAVQSAVIAMAGALVLVLGLAAPAQANNPVTEGDWRDGSYTDADFSGSSHYARGSWILNGSPLSMFYNAKFNLNGLADFNGHATCIQVALDPVAPLGASHADYRAWRDCDGNASWDPTGFRENYTSTLGLKRVQIARYVPDTGAFLLTDCWDFGGDACNSGEGGDIWKPRCGYNPGPPVTCAYWLRAADGTVTKHGSTTAADSLDPDH